VTRSSHARRVALALVLLAFVVGCSPWKWRVRGMQYPAADQLPPVHAGPDGAVLAPESYAIGDLELTGTSMDELTSRAATEGQRHGADAMILLDFEAITAHWTAFHTGDVDGTTLHRAETIETSSAQVSLHATGLRDPDWCLGMSLTCDQPAGSADCHVRIERVLPGGPAGSASLRVGNRILTVEGDPVAHPWDVYQRADAAGATVIELTVDGSDETRTATMAPVACSDLY